ncbi:MAG: nucleotidyltransferase family protein [Bacteroidota bacterium]
MPLQLPVQTKKELIERILASRQRICSYGVKQLGIFGSFVRDHAKESSDVDFFVDFYPERKNFDAFMDLGFYLEELTGRKIEIVTPQSLNKFIGKYITQEVEYVSIVA